MDYGLWSNCNHVALPVAFLSASPVPYPFHSPHIDPVGSIIGLRVTYVDGKLAYVPVEPQINYLINQQFAHLVGDISSCSSALKYLHNPKNIYNIQSFTPPPLSSPYASSNLFGFVPLVPQVRKIEFSYLKLVSEITCTP